MSLKGMYRLLGCVIIAGSVAACLDRRSDADSNAKTTTAETAGTSATVSGVGARATGDTMVRRVPRLVRQPSAIQRVTGVISASVALRPLDSLLVVRVLDARGAELPGANVHWTLAGTGDDAALRIINAVSDSLGLSRAQLTPGRTGSTQSAVAELPGVGRIAFAVMIPAASLTIPVHAVTLWAGDDTTLSARARDVEGNELAGAEITWATASATVAAVAVADGGNVRVTGVRAGTTQLLAFAGDGKVRASARVTVRPVVTGRFITLDGRAPPDMQLQLRAEGVREAIPVRAGAFGRRIELPAEAEVDLHASPVGGTADFHETHIRVRDQRDLQHITIVLVPTTFRIATGTYAGQTVDIDAVRAMQRSGNTTFWKLVPLSGRGPRKLLGWREESYPLRIAFNRTGSAETITAADSVAFWTIARELENDLGRTLFAPAEPGDSARGTVVPVEIRAQSSEGHTFVSWEQAGDAHEGILLFRRASTLRDAHVVTHELVHLLGFGHATGWHSVAQAVGGTQRGLTRDDVGYIQLALRLRKVQQDSGALPGLPRHAM